MPWSPRDRLRGQQWKDLLREVAAEHRPIGLAQLAPALQADALGGELGQTALEQTLRIALQLRAQTDEDGIELLLRAEPVLARLSAADLQRVLEGADLDHEELVEIGAEDREEPDPCQQGDCRILRQREHPSIELEPAELAAQEVVARDRLLGNRARRLAQAGDGPLAGDYARREHRHRFPRLPSAASPRAARPFGDELGPCRDGERGERARLMQHGRPHQLHDLGQRYPLEVRPLDRREALAQAPHEPDLQQGSASGRGRHPQQPYLAVGAAEGRA